MLPYAAAIAVAVFVGAYVLFAVAERWRLLVAAGGAALLLATGIVPLGGLVPTGPGLEGSYVEWNTLGLLAGLFLFAGLLTETGLLKRAALALAARTGGRPLRLLLALSGLSFLLSAFINSITVMLVLATVTIELGRSLKLNPIPYLLAEISASNAGGAATFIGDPPNVIFGTYFHLDFTDFLLHTGLPALAGLLVILLIFARRLEAPAAPAEAAAPVGVPLSGAGWTALAGFAGMIAVLTLQAPLGVPVWAIGVGGGLLALVLAGPSRVRSVLRRFDAETLGFFLFLFVLVAGLETTGLLSDWAGGLAGAAHGNAVLTGSLLLWTFGLISAFVDNVPLAAAAAPFLAHLSGDAGLPVAPLVYASSLGTDIGGNGSPIGASANVVGLAVARKEGVEVGWPRYLKEAFPVMLASLLAANLVWILIG